MEKLLSPEIIKQIQQAFQQLQHPVAILFFGSKTDCQYCPEIQQLLEELAPLSEKLHLSIHDLEAEPDLAAHYNVSGKAPAIILAAQEGDQITDYGIRYLGMPSGHEFGTLIQAILLISGRDSGLSQPTRAYLKELSQPLHLQVYVTPT